AAPLAEVGALLDGLSGPHEALWPDDRWPPMRFDRPLQVGARGGHGPIRYDVGAYEPGRLVRFDFTAPRGFEGHHRFEVEEREPELTRLRHVLEMDARSAAALSWPLVFRPLHDALLENALDRAEISLGLEPAGARWSPWVRCLRWVLKPRGRRARRH
ncbi:SRPBCC family protein, partial [bacterium]|nr:SRPBCC family protein [bacterium]